MMEINLIGVWNLVILSLIGEEAKNLSLNAHIARLSHGGKYGNNKADNKI